MKHAAFLMLVMAGTSGSAFATEAPLLPCNGSTDHTVDFTISPVGERIITGKVGETIFFKFPKGIISVDAEFEEKQRDTRFVSELKSIFKVFTGDKPGVTGTPTASEMCVTYTTTLARASLNYKFKVTDTSSNESEKTGQVKTGAAEHLYFSADVPLSEVKKMGIDPGTGESTTQKVPGKFMFSINYRFNDVFQDDGVSLKFLMEASSKPLNSYGIGIGKTFRELPMLEFFIAGVGTNPDDTVPDNKKKTEYQGVVGIGFNISKGLEWYSSK